MAGAGVYLYIGAKAFMIERGDFKPTSYRSELEAISLKRLLGVAEPVAWQLPDNGVQRAYYRPPLSGAVLILLHGSPGNGAGFRQMLVELSQAGIGSLVIDLPGYGASEGKRSWGTHFDRSVELGIDFLQRRSEVDPSRISILGYSQGGSVASRVAAADERISRLILMASYTNLYDQLVHQFHRRLPGMGFFAVAAALNAGVDFTLMDNIAALSQIRHKPLLVISGCSDHIIPTDMATKLAETSANGELWLVEGAGHLNLAEVAGETLYKRIALFASNELSWESTESWQR